MISGLRQCSEKLQPMTPQILIRGGGDLASGVAIRLQRAGLRLAIAELEQPLTVRRKVSFAEAIFTGETRVEEVVASRIAVLEKAEEVLSRGHIPVLVDPQAHCLSNFSPQVLIDGRMSKLPPDLDSSAAPLVIGLGPGFVAGENCHAVIETNRGHFLGRVIWQGPPEPDTGVPDSVREYSEERVLRAPADGYLHARAEIGDHIEAGQVIAEVGGEPVRAAFKGVLRGLAYPGLSVWKGLKIGDLDPRDDPRFCFYVSDKSLAIGGGVLEAILSQPELRSILWI